MAHPPSTVPADLIVTGQWRAGGTIVDAEGLAWRAFEGVSARIASTVDRILSLELFPAQPGLESLILPSCSPRQPEKPHICTSRTALRPQANNSDTLSRPPRLCTSPSQTSPSAAACELSSFPRPPALANQTNPVARFPRSQTHAPAWSPSVIRSAQDSALWEAGPFSVELQPSSPADARAPKPRDPLASATGIGERERLRTLSFNTAPHRNAAPSPSQVATSPAPLRPPTDVETRLNGHTIPVFASPGTLPLRPARNNPPSCAYPPSCARYHRPTAAASNNSPRKAEREVRRLRARDSSTPARLSQIRASLLDNLPLPFSSVRVPDLEVLVPGLVHSWPCVNEKVPPLPSGSSSAPYLPYLQIHNPQQGTSTTPQSTPPQKPQATQRHSPKIPGQGPPA
ncbi:hypothetical protein MRS44_002890 [Fusarium solani]|uniref:uncharacterized protein n=1 Tax=Fusarium solani TaxID=169388 RepID=UPI0032C47F3F|nr:hypothetical protein MRS44_002890 [Fusarium solani]